MLSFRFYFDVDPCQYARYKKLKPSKVPPFEIYRNDPHQTQPADLLADIHLPLR